MQPDLEIFPTIFKLISNILIKHANIQIEYIILEL